METLCKRLSPCDLVIVEGYKYSEIPKIEVHRTETGHPHLYGEDSRIVAVATDSSDPLPIPALDINAPQEVAAFILNYFSFGKKRS